ncbi:MAG: phage tail protein [Chloroflexi bacterium]|nr:phage tail protein [Chloroflexota bacterium]
MSRIPGVVIGLVRSLDDPEGLGRVQVAFPWLGEGAPEGNWARIAAPLAGPGRGQQFMPEVDDEVLVAFEHGEIRMPYILGYLWNGVDRPPRDDPQKRAIQTVSGHVLEFDDTTGSEKITLLFKGGTPSVTLRQDAVEIKFDGGNYVKISAAGVEVKGAQIQLN